MLPNLISPGCLTIPQYLSTPWHLSIPWYLSILAWVTGTESSVLGTQGPERSLEMSKVCPVVDRSAHLLCLGVNTESSEVSTGNSLPYTEKVLHLLAVNCLPISLPIRTQRTPWVDSYGITVPCRRRTPPLSSLSYSLLKAACRARNVQRKLWVGWKLRECPSSGPESSISPNHPPFFFFFFKHMNKRKLLVGNRHPRSRSKSIAKVELQSRFEEQQDVARSHSLVRN